MQSLIHRIFLIVVAVAVGIMSIRLLVVLIPQRASDVDIAAGSSYLAERANADYTEPSPTPVPTVPVITQTNGFMEIKDKNYKAAFKDIYICGDSTVKAISEYKILDEEHIIAKIGVGTAHLKKHMDEIVAKKPKYLILHYGVNVMDSPENVKYFINSYKECIEELKKRLPDTKIFVDSIFPVKEKAYKQSPGTKYVDFYNDKLDEMAWELGVNYINHTPQFESFEKNYYEGDGIHPIPKYYTEKYLPFVYTEVMKSQ